MKPPRDNDTLRAARDRVHSALAADGRDAATDSLLCYALGKPRAWIYAHPDQQLTPAQKTCLGEALQRHRNGEPLAYLRGSQEFYSLDFTVGPQTLVPRPETELLVSEALRDLPHRARILDLGTGCGNIAVAIAHHRPDVSMTATDVSESAVATARCNAARHRLRNLRCICSDWYQSLAGHFDLIVSNPPYVSDGDPDLEASVAACEPAVALFASADGLLHLHTVIRGAPAYLNAGGRLIVEHGHRHAAAVGKLMRDAAFSPVTQLRDLSGHPRVAVGKYTPL